MPPTEQWNNIRTLTCMYYSTISYDLVRGTRCLAESSEIVPQTQTQSALPSIQNATFPIPKKKHAGQHSKCRSFPLSIGYSLLSSMTRVQNGTGKVTPMLPAVKFQGIGPFLPSCSLIIDMIWNFCLAVQGHILRHDCSNFGIHVLLQNHQ